MHGAISPVLAFAFYRVVDDRKQICPSSEPRVEGDDIVFNESARPIELVAEYLVDEADLAADDFDGRVVGTSFVAELGVIGGEEVLVEIEPGV
jgi:hypothetical protein